jgi:glycosyltransferase involved in cell wall biosynthesis
MTPLSVVMPAYNEEGAIEQAVEDVQTHVLAVVPGAELIVFDDGSRDRTPVLLDRIAAGDARVRVIHQPNGGHGRALVTGLEAATGDFVFLIDSDRQIPLDAFGPLWSVARRSDGAFGVRARRHDRRSGCCSRRSSAGPCRGCSRCGSGTSTSRSRFSAERSGSKRARSSPGTRWRRRSTLRSSCAGAAMTSPTTTSPTAPGKRANSIHGWRLLRFCTRAFVQLAAFRWRLRRVPRS